MRTPGGNGAARGEPGLGEAVRQVSEHARALVGLEVELASLELKRKVAALGKGAALLAAAGVFGLFALGFLLASLAAGLDTFLAHWLSLLLVAVFLLVLVAVLAFVGLRAVRRGTPPTPEQAIAEAKRTTEALRSDGGA